MSPAIYGQLIGYHRISSSPLTSRVSPPVASGPGDCHQLGVVKGFYKAQYLGKPIDTTLARVFPTDFQIVRFWDMADMFLLLPGPPAKMWQQLEATWPHRTICSQESHQDTHSSVVARDELLCSFR